MPVPQCGTGGERLCSAATRHGVQGQGRLQGMLRPLLPDVRAGQPTEFFVNERQQLRGCPRIALMDGREYLRDLGHAICQYTRTGWFARGKLGARMEVMFAGPRAASTP